MSVGLLDAAHGVLDGKRRAEVNQMRRGKRAVDSLVERGRRQRSRAICDLAVGTIELQRKRRRRKETVYQGTVQNGVVVLANGVQLPEGAPVRVELLKHDATKEARSPKDDIIFRMGEYAVETGIPDLGVNIDHYLYGMAQSIGSRRGSNMWLMCLALVACGAPNVYGWKEIQRLAPTSVELAAFGAAVALDHDTLIVGAIGDDASNVKTGAAYIFREDSLGSWKQFAKLTPSQGSSGDRFGGSVAVSGNTAIVGAYLDDGHGNDAGAAYIFQEAGDGQWIEIAKLAASDARANDGFGWSVGISGDTAVVGAYKPGGNVLTSAYIFHRNPSNEWDEIAKLTSSILADDFGFSVAISGDIVLVGAIDDSDRAYHAGSVFMYRRDSSGGWNQTAKIFPNDAGMFDDFGWSIALSENKAIVGAVFNDGSGSAYIFDIDESGWNQVAKLTPSDGVFDDNFGYSVALNGGTAVIGAPRRRVNGHAQAGSTYVFREDNVGEWTQLVKLVSDTPVANQFFGRSVAMLGEVLFIGALNDTAGSSSGLLHVYKVPEPTTLSLFLLAFATMSGWRGDRRAILCKFVRARRNQD